VINKALDKHNVRVFESIETARVLKAIEKHIGMNAVEMRQQLAQKISSQAGEVGLDIITADDKTIKYRVHGRGAGGRQTFTVTQTIDVQKKTAELSLFQVSKAMQGKGIAKSFVRNLLDVYSKAGIGKIDMEANVDVGAYAWARYGWVPKSPGEWSKLKRNIQEYTLSDAPAEERPTIKIILRDKDPKAIRALVAQPSGFKLMKGLSWKGVLDLTNAETKRIVYAYCG
jgi:GNAT superfamily N-acetyltransferase